MIMIKLLYWKRISAKTVDLKIYCYSCPYAAAIKFHTAIESFIVFETFHPQKI